MSSKTLGATIQRRGTAGMRVDVRQLCFMMTLVMVITRSTALG